MKKILVPVDGSKTSLRAAKEALILAEKYQSQVTLLSVVNNKVTNTFLGVNTRADAMNQMRSAQEHLINAEKKAYEKMLKEMMKEFEEKQIKTNMVIREGLAYEEILDLAQSGDYDLIVIGNRGLTGNKKFMMGSVSNRVVDRAESSIFIVKD